MLNSSSSMLFKKNKEKKKRRKILLDSKIQKKDVIYTLKIFQVNGMKRILKTYSHNLVKLKT
jgi:hypothetical protein